MSRSKQKGTSFETLIVRHLAEALNDDRIERRALTGGLDRGDIAGVRFAGHKLALECKNTTRLNLPAWITEAHQEAINDGALAGLIIHKRHGKGQAGDQWVTCTVDDLITLILATQKDTHS